MTPEHLAEIEARWEKATRGPWVIRAQTGEPLITNTTNLAAKPFHVSRRIAKVLYEDGSEDPEVMPNAAAIASAPTDIALLLAEVRRLNQMVDKAIDMVNAGDCLFENEPCPKNYIEVGCRGCAKKYLEREVADNG